MNTGTPPTITLAIEHPARPKKMRTITAARALIGRETGDLVLEDPETSAVHAEIDCTQGHVIVRDLGSSNGTWRGAERLPQFALHAGQSFRCGATTITLVSIEGAPSVTAGRTIVSASREAPQRSGPTAPWAPPSAAPPRAAPAPSPNDSREVTIVARPPDDDDELESLRSTANLPTYDPGGEREVTEVRAHPTTGIPTDDDDDDGAEPAGATLRAPTLARESSGGRDRDTLFPATDEFRPPV
ncbi:MAG TPA: FHA domain-containing protein, partial [Nannocystaceae bacterium]|nr:FHA domain-containing protein [Nannocystaceae bacterium]